MIAEKQHSIRRRKQTVSLLSFLFPSFFPSSFDLEAPLTLEDVCARLEKLPRVRITRQVGLTYESFLPFSRAAVETPTISVAPFDFHLAYRDDDTYLYRADLDDARYKVSVAGYLKRWEAMSTVLTGRVYFNLHYVGVLFKSLVYTFGATLSTMFLIGLAVLFRFELMGAVIFTLMDSPWLLLLWWPIILVALWLNDVVVPAHKGRERLVTRLEDMLLLPDA